MMSLLARIFAIALVLPTMGHAMGLFEDPAPTAMVLTDASHLTAPVVVKSLTINGKSYGHPPYIASSDWENPRGGNNTITSLAPPSQEDLALSVKAEWVEIYSSKAYTGELTVPTGVLSIEDRGSQTAFVTVVFGPGGYFAISTDAGPDPESGQYNGATVAQVCADRASEADTDFRESDVMKDDLAWVYSQESKRAGLPRPDEACNGEGA